jgi:hypothetical protein
VLVWLKKFTQYLRSASVSSWSCEWKLKNVLLRSMNWRLSRASKDNIIVIDNIIISEVYQISFVSTSIKVSECTVRGF